MHVNNYTIPRPPDHLLAQCTEVLIPMTNFTRPYHQMKRWCRENDTSYVWCELVDTSDTSYEHDYIAAFYFIDAKDATMFTLKFK